MTLLETGRLGFLLHRCPTFSLPLPLPLPLPRFLLLFDFVPSPFLAFPFVALLFVAVLLVDLDVLSPFGLVVVVVVVVVVSKIQ